jgi:hypothetical protein
MAGRPLFAYTDFISHPNQPAENRLHPFIFDKPFLLLLRHSVKTEPYFAAWIANSDFMVRP